MENQVKSVENSNSHANEVIEVDPLNNERYPDDFNHQTAPKIIANFANDCKNLFRHIRHHREEKENNNIEKIREILQKYPKSRYFYSMRNVSAAAYACTCKKFDIYEFLIEHRVCIGPHEDVNEIVSDFSERKQSKLKNIHDKYLGTLPDQHLAILIANSYVGHDEFNIEDKKKHVVEAFEFLNQIPQAKILLEVVAASKNFSLMFDFHRTSIQHMAPDNGSDINGAFYFSKQVYVAAMELLNLLVKLKAIGVLGHELCHFAMLLVFGNSSNPFPFGDAASEEEFRKILEECKRNKDKEDIIRNVFDCYGKSVHIAELIVRCPQMLVTYHNDENKLKQLRGDFKGLFEFYENTVMPKMQKALPMLKKLAEKSETIQWNDLTQEIKTTILNSQKINFQGMKTSLKQLNLQKTPEILQKLTSNDIAGIINGNEIKIGKEIDTRMKFYIERDFFMFNEELLMQPNQNIPIKSFQQLAKSNEKYFILIDMPGSGKSSTFKNSAVKMKKMSPEKWISYVDLKHHRETFEKWKNITPMDFSKFFIEIFNLNLFESEIFNQCLNSRNELVIFWDGLDEITPHYLEFMIKLINDLSSSKIIKQWISTRPLMVEGTTLKLCEFNQDNRRDFLQKFASSYDLNGDQCKKLIENVEIFLNSLKAGIVPWEAQKYEITCPLFLQMIAEVQINLFKTNESLSSFNLCSLYEKFINVKFDITDEKGFCTQQDKKAIAAISTTNLSEIHQINALIEIFFPHFYFHFGREEVFIAMLKIMQKTKTWKNEEVLRFGLMFSIDAFRCNFVHRTFAEFFVAQYLYNNVCIAEDEPRDEEALLRLKLLFQVLTSDNCKVILEFLNNFLKVKGMRRPSKYIVENFEKIQRNWIDQIVSVNSIIYIQTNSIISTMNFWSNFFKNNPTLLRTIWRSNDTETLLIKCIKCELNASQTFEFKMSQSEPNFEFLIFKKLKECAEEFFNPEDVISMCDHVKLRHIFIYNFWKDSAKMTQFKPKIKNLFNIVFDEKFLRKLKKERNFFKFFENLNLSHADQLDFIRLNSYDILTSSKENFQEFKEKFEFIENLFGSSEQLMAQVLLESDYERGIIFHYREKIDSLTPDNVYNQDVVKYLIDKYKTYVKGDNVIKLFDECRFCCSPLFITIDCCKDERIVVDFWNYVEQHIKRKDLVRFLLQSSYFLQNPISIAASSKLSLSISVQTSLHRAICHPNPKMLQNVEKIYRKYFTQEIIRHIFKNTFVSFIDNIYINYRRIHLKRAINYIDEMFKDNLGDLREMLLEKNSSNQTFLTGNVERISIKEKVELFKPLMKKVLSNNEINEVLNNRHRAAGNVYKRIDSRYCIDLGEISFDDEKI